MSVLNICVLLQRLRARHPSTALALRRRPTTFTAPREAISGGVDSGFQLVTNTAVFYPKNHTTTLSTFTGEQERAENEEGEATATQQRCVQACPHSKHETAGFFEPSPSTLTPSLPLQLATNPSSPNDDPTSVHIHTGTLFTLKALNRDANAAARAHKQNTVDARQDMDETHLRLQNLLYEKRHLEREIEKCHKFAYVCPLFSSHLLRCSHPISSVYQDIQMYSIEDRVRNRQEGRGAHPCRYEHTPSYTLARLTFRSFHTFHIFPILSCRSLWGFRSRLYAYSNDIKYKTDAKQAIATMNGEWLGSRAIRVNWANQKTQGGPAATSSGSPIGVPAVSTITMS